MRPFNTLRSIAVPMPESDIDTDIILPARFLLKTSKQGLGSFAFYERRYGPDGGVRSDSVLDRPEYRGAEILVAGANFGCGSSREHAPWALLDLGFRCILAPSFGDIFRANCFKNGMLPIVVDTALHTQLIDDACAGRVLTIDLQEQAITRAGGERTTFAIDAWQRAALLEGWDETAMILATNAPAITAFEHDQQRNQPWLWPADKETVNG